MENYQSQYIDKLNIGQVAFNKTDALACTDKKFRRRLDLQKALKLGNLYKQSVKSHSFRQKILFTKQKEQFGLLLKTT